MNTAIAKAKKIIEVIKQLRQVKWSMFGEAKMMIEELDDFEIGVFNKQPNLKKSGPNNKPAINRWLNKANSDDFGFIHFLINT